MHKDLVLFGMQGSGKGTQGKLLLEKFPGQYAYFGAGSLLRSFEESSENAFSQYMKDTIDKGKLVDDNFIIALFDAFLETLHPDQAMIIDGFPRKLFQMYSFRDRMYKRKRDVLGVYFELQKDIGIERIMKRGRSDDTHEKIENRINDYYRETIPVIQHFQQLGKLITIDANMPIDLISIDMMKKLGLL